MFLAITIDTEEDNWGEYALPEYSVDNIQKIKKLQELFDEFEVKPTYLVTYPVATDEPSVSILKQILDDDRCEIGTHLHPWNTPPLVEDKNEKNSMLSNLPPDLQYEKINVLHETIKRNFGKEPVSFRSGRWAFDKNVAKNIHRLGYRIDTSIAPYTSWKHIYGSDFTGYSPEPFQFSAEDIHRPSLEDNILEIPATISFAQRNIDLCKKLNKVIATSQLRKLKLAGILNRLNLVNKIELSPEQTSSKNLIELAEKLSRKNHTILNMFFHSPSLKMGLTRFTKTQQDESEILKRISSFLIYIKESDISPIKLSQAGEMLGETKPVKIHEII